jgi:hypothetical protein
MGPDSRFVVVSNAVGVLQYVTAISTHMPLQQCHAWPEGVHHQM